MLCQWIDATVEDGTTRRMYVIAKTEDRLLVGLEPRDGILVHNVAPSDARAIPTEDARSLQHTATRLRRWWSWMTVHSQGIRMNLSAMR